MASEIYHLSKKLVERHNTVSLFSNAVKEHSKYLQFRKLKGNKWDIFKIGPEDMVVASIRGSDGKEEPLHYFAWQFDL